MRGYVVERVAVFLFVLLGIAGVSGCAQWYWEGAHVGPAAVGALSWIAALCYGSWLRDREKDRKRREGP